MINIIKDFLPLKYPDYYSDYVILIPSTPKDNHLIDDACTYCLMVRRSKYNIDINIFSYWQIDSL